MNDHAEVAAGAVARRADDLLLIRRGHGPAAGQWSLPGGRVHFGEELHEAVVREVAEETGLEVVVERFLGWVERIGPDPDPYHFVVLDFLVDALDPDHALTPGDDATEAAWVPPHLLDGMQLTEGLLEFLTDHEILEPAETVDLGAEPPSYPRRP